MELSKDVIEDHCSKLCYRYSHGKRNNFQTSLSILMCSELLLCFGDFVNDVSGAINIPAD